MAYMNQSKKAKIAAALKNVVPKGWKYSLAVKHHSGIAMTIRAADVDLLRAFKETDYYRHESATCYEVNTFWLRSHLADDELLETFERIIDALNLDNFDHSDLMTDYHHIGHYVYLSIGAWDKPFVCIQTEAA